MKYLLLQYQQRPAEPHTLLTTPDPAMVVEVIQEWRRGGAVDGLLVSIGPTPVIDCPPRDRPPPNRTASAGRHRAAPHEP
jgi:hypothetical protein